MKRSQRSEEQWKEGAGGEKQPEKNGKKNEKEQKSKQVGQVKAGKRRDRKAPERREGGNLKDLGGSQKSNKQGDEGKSRGEG